MATTQVRGCHFQLAAAFGVIQSPYSADCHQVSSEPSWIQTHHVLHVKLTRKRIGITPDHVINIVAFSVKIVSCRPRLPGFGEASLGPTEQSTKYGPDAG